MISLSIVLIGTVTTFFSYEINISVPLEANSAFINSRMEKLMKDIVNFMGNDVSSFKYKILKQTFVKKWLDNYKNSGTKKRENSHPLTGASSRPVSWAMVNPIHHNTVQIRFMLTMDFVPIRFLNSKLSLELESKFDGLKSIQDEYLQDSTNENRNPKEI